MTFSDFIHSRPSPIVKAMVGRFIDMAETAGTYTKIGKSFANDYKRMMPEEQDDYHLGVALWMKND